MTTLPLIDPTKAEGETAEAFEQVKKQFGVSNVPNTFRQMGHKPKFLKALMAMDEVVFGDDALDGKTKHLMAVAVSAACGCEYCVLAHTTVAKSLGASDEEVAEALSVAAVMGAYNNFNKATGLENDIVPSGESEES
jgi:AhpD family alkylhydroperoxidase